MLPAGMSFDAIQWKYLLEPKEIEIITFYVPFGEILESGSLFLTLKQILSMLRNKETVGKISYIWKEEERKAESSRIE